MMQHGSNDPGRIRETLSRLAAPLVELNVPLRLGGPLNAGKYIARLSDRDTVPTVAGILERGRGRCARCGTVAEYEIIDMTGDGSRMDRQWRCSETHRDTHVQDEYPKYQWENRRRR
jgi:hypothetical protein